MLGEILFETSPAQIQISASGIRRDAPKRVSIGLM